MIEAARIIAGLLADTQDIADEDQIARVILDALDAAGFAIVPKVPTEAMLNADPAPFFDGRPSWHADTWPRDTVWSAMLTAAGVKP